GGGLLHRLSDLPHVGAVCGPHEAERAHRLVRELRSLIFERERRFRDQGVDSMAAWHALRRTGLDLGGHGEVFLLIDNWAAFVHELPELEAEVTELAASGLRYGVHLVLAANRWAELRPGLRENLGGRLELRLNDPLESELGRSAAAALPVLPGRGLTQAGLQFQAALPGPAGAILGRAMASREGRVAPPLRLLPTLIGESVLRTADPAADGALPELPFAVEEHRLELVRLDLFEGSPHLLVLGDAECGKSSLLRLIARQLAARYPPEEVALLVVDLRRGLLDLTALPNLAGYACAPATLAQMVEQLHRELTGRTPAGVTVDAAPAAGITWAGMTSTGTSASSAHTSSGTASAWVPERLVVSLNGSRNSRATSRPQLVGLPPGPFLTASPAPLSEAAPGPSGLVAAPTSTGRGPRYVVLVDDYDLLPTSTGSPLLPLLDLLGLGRELGFHLLLARRVAGTARAAFEPVFQWLRELGGTGLVLSGDPGEGPLLGGQKAAHLPPGRGFLVQSRRPPTLVQVLYSPPGRSAEGDSGAGGGRMEGWVGEG
ncbi:MAG TPA: FtsK/SpoIIIE domain-containing protein, partial [Actinomycetota bacterium]